MRSTNRRRAPILQFWQTSDSAAVSKVIHDKPLLMVKSR